MIIRKLVFALSLLSGTAWADQDPYTCELALLGRLWSSNQVVTEAEAKHLRETNPEKLKAELQRAREAVTPTGWEICAYNEYGFDYNDAELLARVWGLADPSEAKARMERKIIYREIDALRAQLAQARAAQGPPPPPNKPADFGPFNFCDADVLAAHWGKEYSEAKAFIRTNVAAGTPQKVTKKLEPARMAQAANMGICQFWSLPYTYEDAEAIAKLWSIDVSEAKARIEQKARVGALDFVDVTLSNAGRR